MWTCCKAFASRTLPVTQMIEMVFNKIESIEGNYTGENDGNQAFSHSSPQCFQKASLSGLLTLYSIDTRFDTSATDSF